MPVSPRFHVAFVSLAVLSLAPGCGEVDASTGPPADTPSSQTPSTTLEGGTDRPLPTVPTANGFGTQVGSEGFWGCTVTSRTTVAFEEPLPSGELSAEKASDNLTGAWSLVHELVDRGTEDGALFLDAPVAFTLVETDSDCGSYIEASVTGLLDRGAFSIAVHGLMALSVDASEIRLAAPSTDDDVREAWGVPSSPELTYLRIDAALDPDGVMLTGAVSHAACLTDLCDRTEELALFAGSR